MPTTSKLRTSSSVTPEIWLKIFQLATFIPHEWDLVASRIDIGQFEAPDFWRPYGSALPLRRSIVEVCRLWHKIGMKLLYASFYCGGKPGYRLAAFAHVLVARPDLGRLVKRLGLRWSPTITDSELIIRHCPNAIIFSSFCVLPRALSSRWVRSLPESLRGLEVTINGIEMDEIIRILFTLPNLESLHMCGFWEHQFPLQHPSLHLSPYPRLHLLALRLLTLVFESRRAVQNWIPFLTNLDAPKLTVLNTDIGMLSNAVTSFPRDIWERITYLKVNWKSYRYIKSTYLLNLHHLDLALGEEQTLPKLLKQFPFHQLEKLTLCFMALKLQDVTEWEPFIRRVLGFPLDPKRMPSLRVLELDWRGSDGDFENSVKCEASHAVTMGKFLACLGSFATQFEKRGVQVLELRRIGGYNTPVLIQEVISACKKHIV